MTNNPIVRICNNIAREATDGARISLLLRNDKRNMATILSQGRASQIIVEAAEDKNHPLHTDALTVANLPGPVFDSELRYAIHMNLEYRLSEMKAEPKTP